MIRENKWIMLPVRDETFSSHSRIGSSVVTGLWLYLSIEFLIGGVISGVLSILDILKSLLPKPPRDLIGDVVLVAGTSSKIGESLAEEFAKNGCSIVCIDDELQSVETLATKLRTNCHSEIQEIGPRHRKEEGSVINRPRISAYQCDLRDRNNIRNVAKKVKEEIGRIDTLVTCIGHPDQDIFDTASMTLMSHYWTVLAFLPSMLLRGRATIVGVTPVASSEDAYLGSRAAIGGLMDSLGQELSNQHHSQLTFLTVAPKADRRLMTQTEQQVAKEVVEAVRRDQCSLNVSWSSRLLYRISCSLYIAITKFTE